VRRWNATAGPLVTKVIVALNVVVFLLTASQGGALGRGGDLQSRLALFGPAVASGEWYRLVTAGFVHYGPIHIAFNMLLLYRFGSMLEPALGRARFVALYVASLLAGSFGALLISPLALTAGASGAVFGLFGAAAVGMRQRGIGLWRSGVGTLIVINLIITFTIPGISIGGHLGGLAGGAAAGSVMLPSSPSRRSTLEGLALSGLLIFASGAGAIWAAHR
jgi:membrane associated rhomboid family serine protease